MDREDPFKTLVTAARKAEAERVERARKLEAEYEQNSCAALAQWNKAWDAAASGGRPRQ